MVASATALFRVADVAQRFGVSRETVLSWIDADELTAINTARAGSNRRFLRITPEAIAAFEKLRQTGKPKSQPASPSHVHKFF